MPIHRLPSLALLLLLCALPACGEIPLLGIPDWERVPGVIAVRGIDYRDGWSVPDSVAAGVPFEVGLTTWGMPSCNRAGDTVVRGAGRVADLHLFDLERDGLCKTVLTSFPRTVTLVFREAGDALIRVHGLGPGDGPVVEELPVVVW